MTTHTASAERLLHPPELAAEPFGDSALMLRVKNDDADFRRAASSRLRDVLLEVRPHGVLDIVAGVESLLVEFDCLAATHEQLAQTIRLAVAGKGLEPGVASASQSLFVIPMVVSEEFSPDLRGVAEELGLSPEAVLQQFSSSVLTINLLAAAMAPMMGGVQFPGQVSRCVEPRTNVEPGSVMVAGTNAIIQPFPGPSGWKVIGRTPLTICDIREDPATSYKPGDLVRFELVPESQWARLEGQFLRASAASRQEGGHRDLP